MKICVQGLWHLGTVTAAGIASLGHEVVGYDEDLQLIENLNQGILPVFEPGLERLVKSGITSGNLSFSSTVDEATKNIEVLWVSYDTPVDDEDNADVSYILRQIEDILATLPVGTTVLVSSQIPVGSIQKLEKIAALNFEIKQLSFAYSPENLRLGKALDTFLKPDRIVIGVRSDRDKERLRIMLSPISEQIEWMSVESAEMTKHAINAFLATSVTFANEIASICEMVGADAKEVERGLKSESRIGPQAYLSPGAAFAGGTLARDVTFLNQLGKEKQLLTPLLSSIKLSNAEHKHWVKRKLLSIFPDISNTTLAVWGLTYKPGTDTLRRSMAVELCDWLIGLGATIQIHDPIIKELPKHWLGKIQRYSDPLSTIENAQALIIATEWPQYRKISSGNLEKYTSKLVVLDANRFLPDILNAKGVRYFAVGTPNKDESL